MTREVDSTKETTAFLERQRLNSEISGEHISKLNLIQSLSDRDSIRDQASTSTKHLSAATSTTTALSQEMSLED